MDLSEQMKETLKDLLMKSIRSQTQDPNSFPSQVSAEDSCGKHGKIARLFLKTRHRVWQRLQRPSPSNLLLNGVVSRIS